MVISIIIPVYNSAATIIESMDSVVRECTANKYSWELILVDDGSVDNSAELINRYIDGSASKTHIRLIRQSNGGAAIARNTGIRAAAGEYIAFNDSDDRWLPGKLSLQVDYLNNNSEVVLVAGIFAAYDMFCLKKKAEFIPISIKDQVLKNYFSPPTVVLRCSVLEKSGLFNENMRYAEEGGFFNNIVFHGKSVLLSHNVAEQIIAKDCWGDGGLSGNLLKMEKGELNNINNAYRSGYISFFYYIFVVSFSIVKFCRRCLLTIYRRLCK